VIGPGPSEDSSDDGHRAYEQLTNGSAGFNALLGGDRDEGAYARVEAHGFFWTASESSPNSAWFYNFGLGGLSLTRQREGSKQMALSVRCVR